MTETQYPLAGLTERSERGSAPSFDEARRFVRSPAM